MRECTDACMTGPFTTGPSADVTGSVQMKSGLDEAAATGGASQRRPTTDANARPVPPGGLRPLAGANQDPSERGVHAMMVRAERRRTHGGAHHGRSGSRHATSRARPRSTSTVAAVPRSQHTVGLAHRDGAQPVGAARRRRHPHAHVDAGSGRHRRPRRGRHPAAQRPAYDHDDRTGRDRGGPRAAARRAGTRGPALRRRNRAERRDPGVGGRARARPCSTTPDHGDPRPETWTRPTLERR